MEKTMETTLNATPHGGPARPGSASRRAFTLALAAASLSLATAAAALPPLYPSGPAQTSSNARGSSDCSGSPAQFGASAASAPVTGAGTTGQYGQNALKGPTMATTRARPSTGTGVASAGGPGIPYAVSTYAAPGFGRMAPGIGPIDPAQSPQRTQRMLALESGQHQPSAVPGNHMTTNSNCLEGRPSAVR
jgi:hypothetical protein